MSREAYPEPPPRAKPGAHSLSAAKNSALIAVVSLLLLVPCFWQPHILAGDLPSHLYNAWLAGQIQQGKLPEQLTLAHPLTNVLADWVSEVLLDRVGPSATERIVAGSAAEIFFWGAFCFVAATAGRRCWIIAPILAMIAYGLVFQIGFLNFYISTGLSLWMMALLWRPRLPWCWLGVPLAALALLAHAIPLVWALAALIYVYGMRMVPEPQRVLAFLTTACLMILAQFAVLVRFPANRWSWGQLVSLEAVLGSNRNRTVLAIWSGIRDCGLRSSDCLARFVSQAVGTAALPWRSDRSYLGIEHPGIRLNADDDFAPSVQHSASVYAVSDVSLHCTFTLRRGFRGSTRRWFDPRFRNPGKRILCHDVLGCEVAEPCRGRPRWLALKPAATITRGRLASGFRELAPEWIATRRGGRLPRALLRLRKL